MASMGIADVIVVAVLVVVVALIIRGMRRGSIRTCDEGSCGGSCATCLGGCATPRIRLTKEQERQLEALRVKSEGVRQ